MTTQVSLSAVTADANGAAINVDVNKLHTVAFGSKSAGYGGGTVKLQAMLPDESTWVDVASATLTANGVKASENVQATKLRLALTGSTTPSALTGWITVDDSGAETTATDN